MKWLALPLEKSNSRLCFDCAHAHHGRKGRCQEHLPESEDCPARQRCWVGAAESSCTQFGSDFSDIGTPVELLGKCPSV